MLKFSKQKVSDPKDLLRLHPGSAYRPIRCLPASISSTLTTPTPTVEIPIYKLITMTFHLRILNDVDRVERLFSGASGDLGEIKTAVVNSSGALTFAELNSNSFEVYKEVAHCTNPPARCSVHANKKELHVVALDDNEAEVLIAQLLHVLNAGMLQSSLTAENRQLSGQVALAHLPAKFKFWNLNHLFIRGYRLSAVAQTGMSSTQHVDYNTQSLCKSLAHGSTPFAENALKRGEQALHLTVHMDGRIEMLVENEHDEKLFETLVDMFVPALISKGEKVTKPSAIVPNSKTEVVADELAAGLVDKMCSVLGISPPSVNAKDCSVLSKPPADAFPSLQHYRPDSNILAQAATGTMSARQLSAAARRKQPSAARNPSPHPELENDDDLPDTIKLIRDPVVNGVSEDKSKKRASSSTNYTPVIPVQPRSNKNPKSIAHVAKGTVLAENAKSKSAAASSPHAKVTMPSPVLPSGTGGMGGRPAPGLITPRLRNGEKHVVGKQPGMSGADDLHASPMPQPSQASPSAALQPAEKQSSAAAPDGEKASVRSHREGSNTSNDSSSFSRQTPPANSASAQETKSVIIPLSRANTALPASSLLNSPDSSPPMHENCEAVSAKQKRPQRQQPVGAPSSIANGKEVGKQAALVDYSDDDDIDDDPHFVNVKPVAKAASAAGAAQPEVASGKPNGAAPIVLASRDDNLEEDSLPDTDDLPLNDEARASNLAEMMVGGNQINNPSPVPVKNYVVNGSALPDAVQSKRPRVNSPTSREVDKAKPVKEPVLPAAASQNMSETEAFAAPAAPSTRKTSSRKSSSRSQPAPTQSSSKNCSQKRARIESDDDSETSADIPKSSSVASKSRAATKDPVRTAMANKRTTMKYSTKKQCFIAPPTRDESCTIYEFPDKDEDGVINKTFEFCYPDNEERFSMHIKRSVRFLRSRKRPLGSRKDAEDGDDAADGDEQSKKKKRKQKRKRNHSSNSNSENDAENDEPAQPLHAVPTV